jgi:hypothetical protein
LVLAKIFIIVLLGAAPWGGIWAPSTAGVALGLRLTTALGLSTAGQFGGVLAILGAFSKAEQHPKVVNTLSRVRTDRVRSLVDRYGILGVPVAVIVLGAYPVTTSLATLGMKRHRIAASVSVSILMMAIVLYFLIALIPLG